MHSGSESDPLQPVNLEPKAGACLRTTILPGLAFGSVIGPWIRTTVELHSASQPRPGPLTVPLPLLSPLETVSASVGVIVFEVPEKTASSDSSSAIGTTQTGLVEPSQLPPSLAFSHLTK